MNNISNPFSLFYKRFTVIPLSNKIILLKEYSSYQIKKIVATKFNSMTKRIYFFQVPSFEIYSSNIDFKSTPDIFVISI